METSPTARGLGPHGGRPGFVVLAAIVCGILPGCRPASPAPSAEGGARITLSPETLELGNLEQFEKISRGILIRNPGDAALLITRIKTDCNCTASELPRRTIPPGGEEEMIVTFSSGRMSGRVKRWVRVESNDPTRPRALIWITAEVMKTELPRIEVAPDRWDMGRIDGSEPIRKRFTIRNGGERPLEVTEITGFPGCRPEWAGPSSIPPGGEIAFDIVLTPPDGGATGVLGGEVGIASGDPARPRIALPVYAFAAGGVPSVRTEYPLWMVGAIEPGEERQKGFRVENRGTAPLRIRFAGSEGVADGVRLDRDRVWTIPPGEDASIPIAITSDASPGVLNFVLGFETDDPRRARIHLAVVGYVREEGSALPGRRTEALFSKVNRREFRWFLGKIGDEERVIDRALSIRNDLDRTVEVLGARIIGARCDLSAKRIDPGDALTLDAHFFPIETLGIGRWDIQVAVRLGDAVEPKGMTVPVTALLPRDDPQADLSIWSWNFGDVETGLEAVRTLRFANDGNRPLRVDAIRNPDRETAGISVIPPGRFRVEPGEFRDVRFALTDPFHRGTVYEELVIRTNDPGYDEIPFVVEGYVRGAPTGPLPAGRSLLRVLYGSDELGRMGPCTCEEGQIGGFARAARLIAAEGEGALLLHAGDLFGEEEPHLRLRARTSIDILDRIGWEGMALGEAELNFGRDFLAERLAHARLPVLCANAFDAATGDRITGAGSTVISRGHLRVGVIGLLGPELIPEERRRELGIRIEDPLATLTAAVPELRESCDVVILLAHLASDRLEGMLETGPDVDLVIAGHGGGRIIHPKMVGGIPLVQNCDRGKYMARVDLVFSEGGKLVWGEGRDYPLSEDVGEDEEVVRMIGEYRRRLRDLPAPEIIVEEGPTFVGARACRECHEREHDVWRGSRHSHALESLADRESDYDPECLDCHTNGYRREGGFLLPVLTPGAGGVQCEGCHGPASDHLEDPDRPYGEVSTPDLCLGCHDAENSAHFLFDEYWPKIQHGPEQ